MKPKVTPTPRRIMVLDIGGSHVRVAFSVRPDRLRIPSGPTMDPRRMMRKLERLLKGEHYDAVTVGYPGVVSHGKILRDPHNLAPGWVGFNFDRMFGCPTWIINDAMMQAVGGYHGGTMLFLGLGTGLGSAMIVDGQLAPMELAHLPYKKGKTYEDYVGEQALLRLGRKKWEREVLDVVKLLSAALEPDYIVIGGGNARKLKVLPPGAIRGDNSAAIAGGIRLWSGQLSGGLGVHAPASRSAPSPRQRRARRPTRRRAS
jgi:predicted NBD/HSP70 family sugar kinase